jgi:hypothetical protein
MKPYAPPKAAEKIMVVRPATMSHGWRREKRRRRRLIQKVCPIIGILGLLGVTAIGG